jgi:DNA-directed RNA polymerase specialized sigma24 family protein
MSGTLAAILQRAQRGDGAAFIDLVAATVGDLRLFIASHVPTQALGDALLREVYAVLRRELARCPGDDVMGWMCRSAATLVGMRLADAARGAMASKDPLTHLVAQAGAEALSLNPDGANPAAHELPRRLQMQPPSLRQLLQRHYQEGLTVATIAEKQGLAESEVAQALLAARARLDWTGVAEVGDTADRTFPSVLEDFLAGTLVPDARAVLTASVLHDPQRGTQFVRQVRLHLLVQVLLTPFDAAQVQDLVAGLPGRSDSSRLIVPPRGGTGRQTRPGSGPRPRGETTRNRRQITETGTGTRRFGTQPEPLAPALPDDDQPPPPNRLPLYLGAGAALFGVVLLVVWWSLSTPPPVAVVPAPAAPAVVAVGDPAFALITQSEGQGLVRHGATSRPAAVGEALASGDGLQQSGAGTLAALVADQVRLTLRGEASVSGIVLADTRLDLRVDNGRVQLDHRRAPRVALVRVTTPEARVELADASALVEVVDGVTRVQTGRGRPRIARADGQGAYEAAPGSVVVVRAGADPAVDGGGVFVRGINFGEGVVTIARNQWLSLNEALGSGLTVGPGARLAPPAQISGVGMDFDTKRMLDTGLAGEGGRLGLTQALPNGAYDLSLWLVGPNEATLAGVTLAVGGQTVPLGPPLAKGERWRRIGPVRATVKDRRLALDLAGLANGHLAGIEFLAAGPLDGALPPVVVITDPSSGSQVPPGDLAIRTRSESASGITRVQFFNRDQVLGEATSPPFTFVWRMPPPGPFALSALASDGAGGTSRSGVVEGSVLDLSQVTGLHREVWRRIGGASLGDLRRHLSRAADETGLVPHSDFRLGGDDFGVRLRGWLVPPVDGEYRLEVVSDDSSEVWLSSDAAPGNRRLVCSVDGHADANQWDKFPSQRSTPLRLRGGERHFIEVLLKQGGGGTHLKLGWVRPDGTMERPIPGERFVPAMLTGELPLGAAPVAAATPTPTTSTPAIPAVIAREVPTVPAGPLLRGTVAPSLPVANLSDLGPRDWIHYGTRDATSVTRRHGADLLSVATAVDNAQIHHYGGNLVHFAWNDGAPVAVSVGTNSGWWVDNRSKGFSFTAPADPVLRRLMVWVGGNKTQGSLTATLSDGSAPPYRDESVTTGDGNGWHCYTLLYRARSNGAKLAVTWSATKAQDGNVTLQAAALAEFGDGKPRFIKGINLGGDETAFGGNTWLSHKDAEAAGLVVYNSRRVTTSGEPVPAVEPGMKPMLRTGVAARSGDLEIHERGLPNGRYDVTLFLLENGNANARLFDVQVNEAQLAGVGQLPRNGWTAIGPLTATVTKGALAITAKAKKGTPQLMGIAIHAAGEDHGPWTNAFPAGRPHRVPGRVLFADFDRGANGVAFQESDERPRNPFYRSEPVGINQYHGAPVVAYVRGGEWLRYTIAVAEAGTYTVTVTYGKANGADTRNARVSFAVDGQAVGGELRLEDTGRWDTPKTITSQPFTLTAGIHDLRALFAGEQDEIGDFWSMEFKKQ